MVITAGNSSDLFKKSEICLITLLPAAGCDTVNAITTTAATTKTTTVAVTAAAGHKSRATAARIIVNVIKEHFC